MTLKSSSIIAAFIDESSSVIVLLTYQHHIPPVLGFSKCGQSAFLNQNSLRFKNCFLFQTPKIR